MCDNFIIGERQKQVYTSVLHVMKEAINMLSPGILLKDYSNEVAKIMENELNWIRQGATARQTKQRARISAPSLQRSSSQ